MARDHVTVWQAVEGLPKPFVGKLLRQASEGGSFGVAWVRHRSGYVARVHRAACSTDPFEPSPADRADLAIRDPVTGAAL